LSYFKIGKTRILIATDILARGIDIHMIVRSGRFGKKDDAQNMKKIERHYQ
jgi:superfamily II DNA/RNA helicase